MRYTLRQLEVFLAVARHQSVSAAASELAMSQSACSGSLADLERQFDVQLFDRVGKRLQLGELGRQVRARAEGLLEAARDLEGALAGREDVGRLRIGATLTVGNYVTVPLMARFLQQNPGADLSLAVANTEEIARQVANFEIDIGLVEGETEHSALDVLPWRDDELVVFCPPQHRFARRRRLDDEDLRSTPWIVREHGSGTRQAFDRAMQGILGDLTIAFELQHYEAIKAAVNEGLGVGCLSRLAIADELRRGLFVACRVPNRQFTRKFYFLLHRDKFRGAAIERWLRLCREVAPTTTSRPRAAT